MGQTAQDFEKGEAGGTADALAVLNAYADTTETTALGDPNGADRFF
jgi:hypothetical protein